MDYQKIYNNIINNALNRQLPDTTYFELHHIIPKCIGGSNKNNNKVRLTYREHFLAHWLLHHIYPDSVGLLRAFNFMAYGKWIIKTNIPVPSSKRLEEQKIKLVKTFSTEEHKQKVINGRLKKHSKIKFTSQDNEEFDRYLEFIKDNDNLSYY